MTTSKSAVPSRNQRIDIAKGIGILAVVIGHNKLALSDRGIIFDILFSFHLPLFFFLSGIFLRFTSSFSNYVALRAAGTLKPYYAVMIALSVIKLCTSSDQSSQYITCGLVAAGAPGPWAPLWFLPALFASSCLCYFFYKLSLLFKSKDLAIFIIALLLIPVGVLTLRHSPSITDGCRGLPFRVDTALLGSAFMMMGYAVGKIVASTNFKLLATAGALVLFCAIYSGFHFTIDLNYGRYDSIFWSTLQALLGIYIVLAASSFLGNSPIGSFIAYLGEKSLYILVFHMYFQGRSFSTANALTDNFVLSCAATFLIGISASLFAGKLIESTYLKFLFLPIKKTQRNPS